MAQTSSKSMIWMKRGISVVGIAVFLAGADWLWALRDIWPRATSDPVPHHCLEALGVIIGGLYLVAKGR